LKTFTASNAIGVQAKSRKAGLMLLLAGSLASVGVAICSPFSQCASNDVEADAENGGDDVLIKGGDGERKDSGDGPDYVEQFIDKCSPLLSKLGFGGIIGVCSGMVIKRVGIISAYLVGFGFIGIQVASHFGIIEVDWFVVQNEAIKAIDTNGNLCRLLWPFRVIFNP